MQINLLPAGKLETYFYFLPWQYCCKCLGMMLNGMKTCNTWGFWILELTFSGMHCNPCRLLFDLVWWRWCRIIKLIHRYIFQLCQWIDLFFCCSLKTIINMCKIVPVNIIVIYLSYSLCFTVFEMHKNTYILLTSLLSFKSSSIYCCNST